MTVTFPFLRWPETSVLVAAFERAQLPLRFVGGCVRDALLGCEVHDVDAATPARPEHTLQALKDAGLMAIPTGIRHGTVTAVIEGKPFEITTLRKDMATDGRHAQVQFVDDWREDAARRDFTMNAMYLSPGGELFDYFGGRQDAQDGVVKFIGDAARRIEEDYLRILRFFRFHAWYGKRGIDHATAAICHAEAMHIDRLSGERIQREMLKLLSAPDPFPALQAMQGKISQRVFGHAAGLPGRDYAHLLRIEREASLPADPLLRLLLLVEHAAAVEAIIERWRLSNLDARRLRLLFEHRFELRGPKRDIAMQKKLLRAVGSENFKALVLWQWMQEAADVDASPFRAMLALAESWRAPHFPVNGEDLLSRGVPAGKEIGEKLRQLEAQWEASDYALSKEQLLARMQKS